jgi:hypothetical protein
MPPSDPLDADSAPAPDGRSRTVRGPAWWPMAAALRGTGRWCTASTASRPAPTGGPGGPTAARRPRDELLRVTWASTSAPRGVRRHPRMSPHWTTEATENLWRPWLVEGRLHMAARALGAAASGMTFLDSGCQACWGVRRPRRCCSPAWACRSRSRSGGGPGGTGGGRWSRPRCGLGGWLLDPQLDRCAGRYVADLVVDLPGQTRATPSRGRRWPTRPPRIGGTARGSDPSSDGTTALIGRPGPDDRYWDWPWACPHAAAGRPTGG